jgi:gluconokinase
MSSAPQSAAPPVLVVMGVTGTGKSTVAGQLSGHLGWELQEGDDLHPPANVAKMSEGIPLTDEDRWPWLDLVAAWIDAQIAEETPGIITCSALKRAYRDRLRRPNVTFIHLYGSRDVIAARLAARLNHFMPTTLLDSQFNTLEMPGADEQVITVDVAATPAEQVAQVLHGLGRP